MKFPLTAGRLKDALNRKNLRAQELADRAGVNKASISQYVNGTHKPSNIAAMKIAQVLGVNPMWLMGFDVGEFDNLYNPAEAMKSLSKTDIIKKTFNDSGLLPCELTDDEIIDIIKYAEFILNKRG